MENHGLLQLGFCLCVTGLVRYVDIVLTEVTAEIWEHGNITKKSDK